MKKLSDDMLINAYIEACKRNLDASFIEILKREIILRGLENQLKCPH